ncbi:hypothetical protein LXL04_033354 [Taraxacum kok-saghyz]
MESEEACKLGEEMELIEVVQADRGNGCESGCISVDVVWATPMANSISSLIVPIDDSPSTVRDLKPVGPILNLPTVRVLCAAQSRLRQRLFVFMTPGESAIPTSNAPFLPWKAVVKGDVFLPVTVIML